MTIEHSARELTEAIVGHLFGDEYVSEPTWEFVNEQVEERFAELSSEQLECIAAEIRRSRCAWAEAAPDSEWSPLREAMRLFGHWDEVRLAIDECLDRIESEELFENFAHD